MLGCQSQSATWTTHAAPVGPSVPVRRLVLRVGSALVLTLTLLPPPVRPDEDGERNAKERRHTNYVTHHVSLRCD